tara:strand:- start:1617 stop:2009 length:393 start_codon:yes stop_codon:yes gene_type:complete
MTSKIYNRKKRDRLKSVFRDPKKSVKFSIIKNIIISIIAITIATFIIIYLNNYPKSYLEFSALEGAYNDVIIGFSLIFKGLIAFGAVLFIGFLQFISLALIIIGLFRLLRVISYLLKNNNKKRRIYTPDK